jgi:hypothetical protein
MARAKSVWVPEWLLSPVLKELPAGVGPKQVLNAKKPDVPPPFGGEWVKVTEAKLPKWL